MTATAILTGSDVALVALVCLVIWLWTTWSNAVPKGLRLPPGPPGKALLGNSTDWPAHHGWETFAKWSKHYGDLVHINIFGQHIIFVNSVEIARNLFERRSSIYSDRIHLPMVHDLMGWDFTFALMQYGTRWRRHRKMFHQKFHATAVAAYYDIHTIQTRDALRRLRKSPDEFAQHIRHLGSATIIEIVYGIKALPTGDPFIERAEKAMEALSFAENPGTFLVDLLPFLKYVPAWMPGAGFQRKARVWKGEALEMAAAPFTAVKGALHSGTAQPSFTSYFLEQLLHGLAGSTEDDIRDVAAVAYAAGSDTTISAMTTFILAMALHPEVQRKAQSELDAVIGMNRLPSFEDRENLPYINALCKEILRWRPPLPLAIGHRVMQDDVYEDYFIPKGTLMIPNSWFMLHDERRYGASAEDFDPERFLKPEAEDPVIAVFGFGRRICPGRYMAQNTVYLAVVSILKVFNIFAAKDSGGNDIPIEGSYISSALIHPEPFPCTITLRYPTAASLFEENAGD